MVLPLISLLTALTALTSLTLCTSPGLALTVEPGLSVGADDLARLYQQAHEAGDAEALGALWREHPDEILVTLDADLEGSLAAWEEDPGHADLQRIAALQARAIWGARIASEVTGKAIFADYASAFAGWTEPQKKSFRQGQAAFGRARQELAQGHGAEALAAAVECRQLAEPLGDWWGTAMGLSMEGKALAGMGRFEEALLPLSRARLLYNQLGLVGAEYGVLLDLSTTLRELGRWERVLVLADTLVVLSDRFQHDEGRALGEELKARALQELGREG